MLPHEREMVKRLADKPFTLLGINSDKDRSVLKKVIKDEKITWENIYDGPAGEGEIARRWNVYSWPTIYLIDHEGVIRHRDLRGDALEEAAQALLERMPGA
jgi:hypothetical protein